MRAQRTTVLLLPYRAPCLIYEKNPLYMNLVMITDDMKIIITDPMGRPAWLSVKAEVSAAVWALDIVTAIMFDFCQAQTCLYFVCLFPGCFLCHPGNVKLLCNTQLTGRQLVLFVLFLVVA